MAKKNKASTAEEPIAEPASDAGETAVVEVANESPASEVAAADPALADPPVAEPPAAAPAVSKPAGEPDINDLLPEAAKIQVSGFIQRSPHCELSGEEAQIQARLFAVLHKKQVRGLRDQGAIYGYLLRQIGKALAAMD